LLLKLEGEAPAEPPSDGSPGGSPSISGLGEPRLSMKPVA
jgi:hypothetical protein